MRPDQSFLEDLDMFLDCLGGDMEEIQVKVLKETASLPTYGSEGASCADLYSAEVVVLPPQTTKVVKTGLAMKIPYGWGGFIRSRSGLATKGVVVRAGVIDSDYRGEIGIVLHNSSLDEACFICIGDRIAQIDFRPVYQVVFVEVPTLDETARGENGFGSTGHK